MSIKSCSLLDIYAHKYPVFKIKLIHADKHTHSAGYTFTQGDKQAHSRPYKDGIFINLGVTQ